MGKKYTFIGLHSFLQTTNDTTWWVTAENVTKINCTFEKQNCMFGGYKESFIILCHLISERDREREKDR